MGLSFTETFFEAPPPSARRTLHRKISGTLSQTLQIGMMAMQLPCYDMIDIAMIAMMSVKTSVPL